MQAVLGAEHAPAALEARLRWAGAAGPLSLIGLDTLVEGEPWGEVGARQLDWLAERLDEVPDGPVLLLLHRPPLATGIRHMDAIRCRDSGPLAALVGRIPTSSGSCAVMFTAPCSGAGRAAWSAPGRSTAHQISFDLD